MHLDKLLADGGVDGDLLAEHLHLFVGHDLDVSSEPFPSPGPLVRRRSGGGGLGPVPPVHPLATGRTKWPGSEGGHATGIGKVARCLCSGMELRKEGNRPVRQAPRLESLGGDAGGGWLATPRQHETPSPCDADEKPRTGSPHIGSALANKPVQLSSLMEYYLKSQFSLDCS
jgi:hypothetical protein